MEGLVNEFKGDVGRVIDTVTQIRHAKLRALTTTTLPLPPPPPRPQRQTPQHERPCPLPTESAYGNTISPLQRTARPPQHARSLIADNRLRLDYHSTAETPASPHYRNRTFHLLPSLRSITITRAPAWLTHVLPPITRLTPQPIRPRDDQPQRKALIPVGLLW